MDLMERLLGLGGCYRDLMWIPAGQGLEVVTIAMGGKRGFHSRLTVGTLSVRLSVDGSFEGLDVGLPQEVEVGAGRSGCKDLS